MNNIKEDLGQILSDQIRDGNEEGRDWNDAREIDLLLDDLLKALIEKAEAHIKQAKYLNKLEDQVIAHDAVVWLTKILESDDE